MPLRASSTLRSPSPSATTTTTTTHTHTATRVAPTSLSHGSDAGVLTGSVLQSSRLPCTPTSLRPCCARWESSLRRCAAVLAVRHLLVHSLPQSLRTRVAARPARALRVAIPLAPRPPPGAPAYPPSADGAHGAARDRDA
eukprot:5335618-Prymnesium_polylepis.1